MFSIFNYGSIISAVFPDVVNSFIDMKSISIDFKKKAVTKAMLTCVRNHIESNTVLPYHKKLIIASCIPCNNWRRGSNAVDTYHNPDTQLKMDHITFNIELNKILVSLSKIDDYYIIHERSMDAIDLNDIIYKRYCNLCRIPQQSNEFIVDNNKYVDRSQSIPDYLYTTTEQILLDKGLL